MAAYATLVPLIATMDHIQKHPLLSISFDTNQMQSIIEKVGFLLDFVENDTHGVISEQLEVLESQIAAAAYAAEDLIESHGGSISVVDLQTVIDDMDSATKKVMAFKEEGGSRDNMQPTYLMPTATTTASSSTTLIITTDKNTMVGFDEQLTRLLDMLTGQRSNRQIIPIVGMGGIGKTTLAKNGYEHSLIVQHFDIRTWVTVSQKYNVIELLLQLLREKNSQIDEQLLGEKFPILEKLFLTQMYKLGEVPLDIGEIPTLGFLQLLECSESAAISAMRIAEEQENNGNEELQVRVVFDSNDKFESFQEKMKQSGDHHINFTRNNFQAMMF